jgi:anti-sigma-K factor RskA
MSSTLTDPPDDDLDILAGEYLLGLLEGAELARVASLRASEPRFDIAISQWEMRLLPLADELEPVQPGPRVWPAIAAAIAPAAAPQAVIWNSVRFWRYFGLGTGALGAGLAVALAAVVLFRAPPPLPIATATLASQNAGIFVATAQKIDGGIILVVSPSQVSVPSDKSAELWLITPGSNPKPLGLLASDHAVTVNVSSTQFNGALSGAELAVSIEPPGGSPTGLPTGPVIAAAKFLPL